MTLFTSIYNTVESAIASYVTTTSENIITFITPIFTSLLIIYITIYGLSLMLGRNQEPLSEGAIKVIKVGFIVTLGLTLGTYNGVVVSFIQGFPEAIGGALVGAGVAFSSSTAIDALNIKLFGVAAKAWDDAGFANGNFGLYFIAIAIIVAGSILLIMISALILISKIATAVLLGIGPVFIMMLLFKSTEKFFETWLGLLINYALVLILATAIGSLILDIVDGYITTPAGRTPTVGDTVAICIVFGLAIIAMKQVQGMASALGGGIALATNGAISSMMGKAAKASPANIKRTGRNLARNYSAARAPDRAIMRSGGKAVAAYQRKFGKGNSISS